MPSSPASSPTKKRKKNKRPTWFPFGQKEELSDEEPTAPTSPASPQTSASDSPVADKKAPFESVSETTESLTTSQSTVQQPSTTQPVAESGAAVFQWVAGTIIPQGSQLSDGSAVPEGAQPQPEGFVLLPDGSRITAEEVTLPDGVLLSSVLTITGEAPAPSAVMPDGSKPSQPFGWGWLQESGLSVSSTSTTQTFTWIVGGALPQGTQMLGGFPLPEGAAAQSDGSVLMPDGSSLPADQVILPDGSRLSEVLANTPEFSVEESSAVSFSQTDVASAPEAPTSSADVDLPEMKSPLGWPGDQAPNIQDNKMEESVTGMPHVLSHLLEGTHTVTDHSLWCQCVTT